MKVSAVGKPEGCKLLRLDAEVEGGTLVSLSLRGDFFAIPEDAFERVETRLPGTPLDGLAARFDALLAEEGVEAAGITGAGLEATLREGMSRA